MGVSLETFSTELLLKIFKYLNICDLCKLKQTCKRFNEIIERWAIVLCKPVVTNQEHPLIIQRSRRLIPPFESLRISHNWQSGIYKERKLLPTRVKYIPWLQLEKNYLWVSRGGAIKAYHRNGLLGVSPKNASFYVKKENNRSEVYKFVVRDDLILSGQTDGSLWLWSKLTKKFIFCKEDCHEACVNTVDFYDNVIVSGSRDNCCKIWKFDEQKLKLHSSLDLNDRVWSVSLQKDVQSLLAIGTAGITNASLIVTDIGNHKVLHKFSQKWTGAGVLDIKWDSPFVLWSCGYDSYVRKWDLRSGRCEQALADPGGCPIYCFEYDYTNSIISGTQRDGRSVLWDIRKNDYIQMYFMQCCKNRSSPIYSLSFDPESLFTVTDHYLNIMEFVGKYGKARDYSNLFQKVIIA